MFFFYFMLSLHNYALILRGHSLAGRVKLDLRGTRQWAVLCGGPVRRLATTHVTRTATVWWSVTEKCPVWWELPCRVYLSDSTRHTHQADFRELQINWIQFNLVFVSKRPIYMRRECLPHGKAYNTDHTAVNNSKTYHDADWHPHCLWLCCRFNLLNQPQRSADTSRAVHTAQIWAKDTNQRAWHN